MSDKVIFIIGTLSSGGAERVVSNLSMKLPKDITKEIILFGEDAKTEYEYIGKLTYLDRDNPGNPLTKFITLIKRLIKLNKIKKQNPNVTVISFLEYPNLLNLLSGRIQNSIVSVRNYMSVKHIKGLKASFWNFTIRQLYGKAREIIVVTEQMKTDLIEVYNLPKEKIKVIYNSYPINTIANLTKEKLTNNELNIFLKPTIITAGRLNKQKGQHHMLNAFKKVKSTIPDAQLVFLGEGNLKSQLKEQAKEFELEDSIHFLGFQKNPFKYMAKSKVFVMTSYYEGFPNALAEAMACNVPVISTDCPSGPREIIAPDKKGASNIINEYQYGFLVPAFSEKNQMEVEQLIAELIIDLVKDKKKHELYAKRAYERIREFDINKIIKEWEEIIENSK